MGNQNKMMKAYYVGNKVWVKVLRIDRDNAGHVTGVVAGATDAILEDAKERSYLVSEGATAQGRISNMIVSPDERIRAVRIFVNSELPMCRRLQYEQIEMIESIGATSTISHRIFVAFEYLPTTA